MDQNSNPFVKPVAVTHADWHPHLLQQPIAPQIKTSWTPAQKASRKIAHDINKTKSESLKEALRQFMSEQDEILAFIADEHSVTVQRCEDLISTALKPKRRVNCENALLSYKADEINSALPVSSKKSVKELRELLHADMDLMDASDERVNEIKEELEQKRITSSQGSHLSHRSEAKDIGASIKAMSDEFYNLNKRTGAIGFGFVTRGDIDCTGEPGWFISGDSDSFLKEIFHCGPWDILRLFESFAIASSKRVQKVTSAAQQRVDCAAAILGGLKFHTRHDDVKMSYTNYEKDVIVQLKFKLIGWPSTVPFRAPSTLERLSDVSDLLSALRSGACQWKHVSHQELLDAQANLADAVPVKRKRRSDAGVSQGQGRKAENYRHFLH
ncbi:hypothetical protein C8J56DRAFT_898977 [Mycena floridula]|nr:hypothetical protein C8J56DRAFT_898977 [Mycena floridula]